MELQWNYETDQPLLKLDGLDHDTLPYLTPDFKLDDQELPLYQADCFVNGYKVTTEYEPFEWEPHVYAHKIKQILGEHDAKRILFIYLSHTTGVTNEVLDVIANNAPASGYEALHFEKFYKCMDEPMAMPIMNSLVQTTKNLQRLTMTLDSYTYGRLGAGGKESFGELASMIIMQSE